MSDHLAIKVRKRLPNRDSHDNDRNKQEPVHDCIDQKWKNVIEEKNEGDDAVQNSDACLGKSDER